MKKWSIVGILSVSLFAICLGSIVAFLPIANHIFTGNFQWNLLAMRNIGVESVEELRAPVDGPADLNLNTPFGKVDVTGQEGLHEIQINAHKYAWGADQKSAEELLSKVKVVVRQTGNSVQVYVDQPVQVDILHIGPAGVAVDFTVTVPTECAVQASSSSGAVSLRGIAGRAVVHSSFGDVTAGQIRGGVKATSSSGAVTVTDVTAGGESVDAESSFGEVTVRRAEGADLSVRSSSGEVTVEDSSFTGPAELRTSFGDINGSNLTAGSLEARTNSGKVTLQGVKADGQLLAHSDFGEVYVSGSTADSYNLDTNSGSITSDNVQGKVKAHSGFGDIAVRGTQVVLDLSTNSGSISFTGSLGDGLSSLHTNFGDIDVRLPEDTQFSVDLSTNFGDVECGFPVTSTRADSSHLVGTVGAGGPTLQASTNSGSVSVQPQPAS
jgi:DUF4097 and DUF4098 domain-containing protein YvlB